MSPSETIGYDDIQTKARDLLGLTPGEAYDLFLPGSIIIGDEVYNPFSAKPENAVKVLDHLKKTGRVDWSVAAQ